jgi:hypothetical protein
MRHKETKKADAIPAKEADNGSVLLSTCFFAACNTNSETPSIKSS